MSKFVGYKETNDGVLTIVEDNSEIIAGGTTNCGVIPSYKKEKKNYTSRQRCLEALIDEINKSS